MASAAEPEEISLNWRQDKLGDGIQLDSETTTVSRRCQSGFGVQLADAWFTKDITTVAIECHELTDDAYIGLVGRNYNPCEWTGKLSESPHAVVLHAGTGRASHKGSGTTFVLRKLRSGTRLVLTIDMQKREVTFELKLGADEKAESTLIVEDIQAEVAVAVCLGPGDQSVRLAGCVRSKPEFLLLGKRVKDFWDEENVVPPLGPNAQTKSNEEKMREAMSSASGILGAGPTSLVRG